MIEILIAGLIGNISNIEGHIGIREDWNRTITRVYLDSPAYTSGIRTDDKILTEYKEILVL